MIGDTNGHYVNGVGNGGIQEGKVRELDGAGASVAGRTGGVKRRKTWAERELAAREEVAALLEHWRSGGTGVL